MVVPIKKRRKGTSEKETLPTLCDANIPLSFIEKISSGTIKLLAKNVSIVTLEELHHAEENVLREKIKNKKMLQEIFDLRQQILKNLRLAKFRNLLFFDEHARNMNVKVKPDQRAQILGLLIFATLCKNPVDVISYILYIEGDVPYRQKAVILKISEISKKAVKRA